MIFHVGCVVEGCVKCDSHGNLLHGVGTEGISPKKKPDLKRSGFLSVTEVRICLSLICQFPGKTLQCRVEANRSFGRLSLSM